MVLSESYQYDDDEEIVKRIWPFKPAVVKRVTVGRG